MCDKVFSAVVCDWVMGLESNGFVLCTGAELTWVVCVIDVAIPGMAVWCDEFSCKGVETIGSNCNGGTKGAHGALLEIRGLFAGWVEAVLVNNLGSVGCIGDTDDGAGGPNEGNCGDCFSVASFNWREGPTGDDIPVLREGNISVFFTLSGSKGTSRANGRNLSVAGVDWVGFALAGDDKLDGVVHTNDVLSLIID